MGDRSSSSDTRHWRARAVGSAVRDAYTPKAGEVRQPLAVHEGAVGAPSGLPWTSLSTSA